MAELRRVILTSSVRWVSQQEGLFQGTGDKACLDLWDFCLLPVRMVARDMYLVTWTPLWDTQVIPGRMLNSKPAHLAQVLPCGFLGESPGRALSCSPALWGRKHSMVQFHSPGLAVQE